MSTATLDTKRKMSDDYRTSEAGPLSTEQLRGESPQDVADRADCFIARILGMSGDILAFSGGHIIRMIAARWMGLSPAIGRDFYCNPASVGVLGFEHGSRKAPILRLRNFATQPAA